MNYSKATNSFSYKDWDFLVYAITIGSVCLINF